MSTALHNQNRLLQQAKTLFNAGNYAGAARLVSQLVKHRPRDARLLGFLASIQIQQGKLPQARANLHKAIRIKPDPGLYRDLGRVLRHEGRIDDARKALQQSLRLAPGVPGTIAALAELEYAAGEHQRAIETLEPHLDNPDHLVTSALALIARRAGGTEYRTRAIDIINHQLEADRLPPNSRSVTLFRLGHLLDAEGRYDDAFQIYTQANESRDVRFDADRFSADIDALIQNWTPDVLPTLPRSKIPRDYPIFVVGMPRSGTSLTEQILASHPRIEGGGEMGPLFEIAAEIDPRPTWACIPRDPSRITRSYADRSARRYLQWCSSVSKRADRIVDKQITDFLYLGLIWCLFPDASVVHIRRNPIDCCLSSYFQAFPDSVSFAFDLTNLGRAFHDYERLMRHWSALLDTDVLEIEYEQLVADQEATTRRLIEHVGLDWDDACLRFHETDRSTPTASNDQVRQPMYNTSVERWRNYEKHLGPLFDALGDLAQR